jgi:catechol 2,3-dioxygenase-like lactoylglutathione lyase family enzyme
MPATAVPTSLLTHIALPVRDLDATLAFYEKYTTLRNISERTDPDTGLRTAWLANERDVKAEGTARFVIVLICGKLPTKITGDIKEEYGFLRSIAHLGLSLGSRDEVDRIAEMAREDGCLLLGPMYRNEVVGYICVVTDPDGNNLEFSVEQDLG